MWAGPDVGVLAKLEKEFREQKSVINPQIAIQVLFLILIEGRGLNPARLHTSDLVKEIYRFFLKMGPLGM